MKEFKTKITIESIVEIVVQAEDEIAAVKVAKEIAIKKFSEKSCVIDVETAMIRETPFKVGSKVKHKLFGVGLVKELVAIVSGGGEEGWSATIEFEDERQDTKQISICPGKQHLELLDG